MFRNTWGFVHSHVPIKLMHDTEMSEKTKAKPSLSKVNTAPALFSQLPSKTELWGLWPESKASPAAGLCSLTQEKQEGRE